jgi:hypothetical protein
MGPTQVINFVVAMAGEAYDAHEQEVQNGKGGTASHIPSEIGLTQLQSRFPGAILLHIPVLRVLGP